jgi:hypothetical protein
VNTPIKVAELGDLNLGGRDFIYLPEERLLFVAMSDMNITSRLDAYLTNVLPSLADTFSFLYLGKNQANK